MRNCILSKIYVGQHIETGKPTTQTYTVKRGDTLSEVAKAHHTSVGDVLRANPGQIANRNLIYPGQKLHIPVAKQQNQPQPTKQPTTKQPTTTTPTEKKTPSPTKPQTPIKTETPVEKKPTTPVKINPPVNTTPKQTVQSGNLEIKEIDLDEFLSPKKGSDAGYAILIGNAEGNRKPNGDKKPSYYGHRDPGDGKWNIGSFSYSNDRGGAQKAASPEDADRIQLGRLYKNKDAYVAAMNKAGLDPNNALLATVYFDMYNQSPTSAELLLKPDNLKYLKDNGITIETMKEWRYRGFINPDTGKQRNNSRGKLAGGNLASGNLNDGYAGLANRNAQKKYNRPATEDELKVLIRRDQNRRVDGMIQPLKNVGLLKINSQKEVSKPPSQTPQNVNEAQKSNEVVFNKSNGGAINVLLPANDKGYTTYNNDGNDHYGTAHTIKALQTISAKWNETHPESKLQIGDISKKGGGHLAPHGSHRKGIDADIRPFRKDGKLAPLNAVADPQNFDRDKTREFIKLVKKLYPNTVILFNDKQLINEGLTKKWKGHDNHLHIHFK